MRRRFLCAGMERADRCNWRLAISMLFLGVLLTLALSLSSAQISADYWVFPTAAKYESQDGNYVFHTTPVSRKEWEQDRYGNCRGELYLRDGQGLKLLWARPLVNNVAPCGVFVANSGKFAVTIAEWARADTLPVVFYGQKGEVINVYGRLDHLTENAVGANLLDLSAVDPRDPTTYKKFRKQVWLADSLFLFGPNDDHFVIRLWNGEVLLFETENGQLIDERWKKDYESWKTRRRGGLFVGREGMMKYEKVKDKLKTLIIWEALRLASSRNEGDVAVGAVVLGQHRDEESVRILQEATQDATVRIIEGPRGKARVPYTQGSREGTPIDWRYRSPEADSGGDIARRNDGGEKGGEKGTFYFSGVLGTQYQLCQDGRVARIECLLAPRAVERQPRRVRGEHRELRPELDARRHGQLVGVQGEHERPGRAGDRPGPHARRGMWNLTSGWGRMAT